MAKLNRSEKIWCLNHLAGLEPSASREALRVFVTDGTMVTPSLPVDELPKVRTSLVDSPSQSSTSLDQHTEENIKSQFSANYRFKGKFNRAHDSDILENPSRGGRCYDCDAPMERGVPSYWFDGIRARNGDWVSPIVVCLTCSKNYEQPKYTFYDKPMM